MTQTPLWQSIADAIRQSISNGEYVEGQKLPTEAAYAKRFGVNRHTIRHAMSHLLEDGVVHSRRGAGYFVLAPPLDYPIGERVRFHNNLIAAGHTPKREVLSIETRKATRADMGRLKVNEGDLICVCHGRSFSDGAPLLIAESHFPLVRLVGIDKALMVQGSITVALRECGVEDYVRHSTRVSASLANATQAAQLRVREGAPLLYTTSINVDTTGFPVEYGQAWFASERVTITLDHANS
ncbi:phosphonate metabolism transcriptional regulator PhnF [Maritalea porphyrae]|uniref:phosphonate metabolism transcriptional regulator PhnF n=1 Tax=Maritalea porphyrae TaxID=880732 RepID=UPI0022AFCBC9|nr:phosphonate metabolism transcriptional regulator PhnF [Maritalea porphyrae]MCZ4273391.1 phosphonate metabolism transcriptional regulator PhnF [Maritalea porphyrae]